MTAVGETLGGSKRLADVAPELARVLRRSVLLSPPRCSVADVRCETVTVPMRDGVRLATDVYLPPERPAPAVATRTPYGRGSDPFAALFLRERGERTDARGRAAP